MKSRVIVFLVIGGFLLGADHAAAEAAPKVPILLYHHLQDLPKTAGPLLRRWTLSPRKLEDQLAWLTRHGFHTVTMAQLVGHLKHQLPLPFKPIVLTFDDGWRDHYEVAFPLLKKYHSTATFFIITEAVGHSAYVDWKQIQEMAAAGMDIEAHSLTHPKLTKIPPQEAFQEIQRSKQDLEKHLLRPVTVFAYPFGAYNDRVIGMVKRAGFEGAAAVSGMNGSYLYRADGSYTLFRKVVMNYESLDNFTGQGEAFAGGPAQRGLFVSLVQEPPVLSSLQEITALLEFAKKARINTLFVQIYYAGQAWFPFKTADAGPCQANRKKCSQDTFAQLMKQAHRQGIQVHAWINLLSLGKNQDAAILKKYGTDILTRNLKEKKSIEDYKIDGQYFLEPGDPRVSRELAGIVTDILRAYPKLDGLQFDYIRYPDQDPHYGYSTVNVQRFQQASGLQTIEDDSRVWKTWKRDQVTRLLAGLVKKARQLRARIQISTTGCMPYARAYEEAFQDWPSWLSTGLVDFVTIMDYSPVPSEFNRWIQDAKTKTKDFDRVKIGIGAYRFIHSPQLFEQEFLQCEQQGSACVIFHYGSLRENPALQGPLKNSGKDQKQE